MFGLDTQTTTIILIMLALVLFFVAWLIRNGPISHTQKKKGDSRPDLYMYTPNPMDKKKDEVEQYLKDGIPTGLRKNPITPTEAFKVVEEVADKVLPGNDLPGINKTQFSLTLDKDWMGTPEKAKELETQINQELAMPKINPQVGQGLLNILTSLEQHKRKEVADKLNAALDEDTKDFFKNFSYKKGKINRKP